jgi:hypothetical protein
MGEKVDFTGIPKALAFAELYNSAKAQGWGFFHATEKQMSVEDAKKALKDNRSGYFDYHNGRVMKVNMKTYPLLGNWGYDRDNGKGKMQEIADKLKNSKEGSYKPEKAPFKEKSDNELENYLSNLDRTIKIETLP